MTLLGLKLWLSLQEGNELISWDVKCLPQVQQVVSSSRAYAEEGQMALHPQNVEWQRPVEPQMWNPAQVKLLALDCGLMDMRCGLFLSWPWLKWRGLCSTRCVEVCGVVLLQTHNFWASNSRIWGTLQLTRLFCNLKGLCDMKMEKIRGLNMNLNVGWHF